MAGGVAGNGPHVNQTEAGGQRARVLYDYDAADMTELSLAADEVSHHGFCCKRSKVLRAVSSYTEEVSEANILGLFLYICAWN